MTIPTIAPMCLCRFHNTGLIEKRFRLLIRSMCWVAVLSTNEAACAIRDFKHREVFPEAEPGGEAVSNFGGSTRTINRAITVRNTVRRAYKLIQ